MPDLYPRNTHRRLGGARGVTLAVLVSVMTWAGAPGALELGINCGGGAFVSENGIAYSADQLYTQENGMGYTGGSATDNWHPIAATDSDSAHYTTLRSNFIEYRFDVPQGHYLLRIRMAEHEKHGLGERIFWLWAEGSSLVDSLDIFAQVGRDCALDYQFALYVPDTRLTLYSGSYIGAPILSGIQVVSRNPDASPPPAPPGFTVQSSFREMNLDWDPPAADDLGGYRIYRSTAPGGPFEQILVHQNLITRHIDGGLDPAQTYYYYATAVDAYGNESAPTGVLSGSPLDPLETQLRTYELTVDPGDIRLMNENFGENYYVPCTFLWDQQAWTCQIRYKGSFVRSLAKKSYRLNFPDADLFEGRERVHLNAEMPDPSLVRNNLTLAAHRLAGIPAVTSRYFLAYLNQQFLGLYHDLEQYDGHYLDARPWMDQGANLYKAEDGATLEYLPNIEEYEIYYDKSTNEIENDWTDLQDLTAVIDLASDDDLFAGLAPLVDFESLFTYYAAQCIVQNVNCDDHNYYMYHDLDLDKWIFLPWDADFTWGYLAGFSTSSSYTRPLSSGSTGNRLLERIWNHDFFRRRYVDRILWLLETGLSSAVRDSLITGVFDRVGDTARRDWYKWQWEDNTYFDSQMDRMQTWSVQREQFLRSQIPYHRPEPIIVINELLAANESTLADEFGEFDDFVELYNPGDEPVALDDYYMTDDFSWLSKWALPDTTLDPGGHLLIWADGQPQQGPLHTNFSLSRFGEEIGIFRLDLQAGLQPEDALAFGEQATDTSYARRFDADVVWEFHGEPTPGEANSDVSGAPSAAHDSQRLLFLEGAHPFHGRGAISLRLPSAGPVVLTLHDIAGRRIRTLWAGPLSAGLHTFVWDGRGDRGGAAAAGIYWAVLRSPARRQALKLILLRP
ncbi:MAG: hypothetical protein GF355_13520 [Candidatus Eisenbacteria bacterium]|nr:hypothetical protein [Candidatus Eisenbacteria bacterium]